MPAAPYRQWTLSLPRNIRHVVIRNPKLLPRVLSLFLRVIFAYQRRRARKEGIKAPLPGAITLLQFWGSILQLTPHAHSWIPDGVFFLDVGGELQFHRLAPPTGQDIKALLHRIETRVTELQVAGGGSQSDAAVQLTADLFGLPASRPHV